MSAQVLQFKSRDLWLLEHLIDEPCPRCGQVIYEFEIPLHLQHCVPQFTSRNLEELLKSARAWWSR